MRTTFLCANDEEMAKRRTNSSDIIFIDYARKNSQSSIHMTEDDADEKE